MFQFTLDKNQADFVIQPTGPLAEADFEASGAEVNPFIETNGALKGVVIDAAKFSGQEGFGAALDHFRFIRDHRRHIARAPS